MMQIPNYKIEEAFPAKITPLKPFKHHGDFLEDVKAQQEAFKTLLLKHGALLFRGFPVQSAQEFANVITALSLGKFVNYIGGDSPRDKVEEQVYTSTEAPPSLHIPLHQELSFIKHFPRHIYFFCEIPAQAGGATVIGDARKIFAHLSNTVKARFAAKGLTYTSRYYFKSRLMQFVNHLQRSHKSWIEVFETDDKEEVEQKCRVNEFDWRWLKHDWLEIKQTRPALLTHPVTQEPVWFNQAHLYDFNPRLLGLKKYIAAKLFYMRRSMRLHEIEFADQSRIPRADLYHILEILKSNTVAFPWQAGDVMVLDNILTMHGRAPFVGKRRVLTALTA